MANNNLEGGILDPANHSDVLNATYLSTIFIIYFALVNPREFFWIAVLQGTFKWHYAQLLHSVNPCIGCIYAFRSKFCSWSNNYRNNIR